MSWAFAGALLAANVALIALLLAGWLRRRQKLTILAELRASEERFRSLIECAPLGISIVRDSRVVYANPASLAMFGRTRLEDAVNRDFSELIAASHREEVFERYRRRLAGEPVPSSYETVALRVDGSEFPAHVELRPFLLRDGPALLVFIFDVTEQVQGEEKALEYQEQLRALASQLTLAEERERRRIAAGLHDRIGPVLASLNNRLHAVHPFLPTHGAAGPGHAALDAHAARQLEEMILQVEEAIRDVRTLTFELSPPVLYQLGLLPALQWLAEDLERRHGLVTEILDDGQPKPLDEDLRVLLFRAVQELLFNTVKHAGTKQARVVLRRSGDRLLIEVADGGRGFEVPPLMAGSPQGRPTGPISRQTTGVRSPSPASRTGSPGFGLFNIRERLSHLGGCLEIESSPGRGTKVSLTASLSAPPVPMQEAQPDCRAGEAATAVTSSSEVTGG